MVFRDMQVWFNGYWRPQKWFAFIICSNLLTIFSCAWGSSWCWKSRLLSSSCSAVFSAFVHMLKRNHHPVYTPAHKKGAGSLLSLKCSLASYPCHFYNTQLAGTKFHSHSWEAGKYCFLLGGQMLLELPILWRNGSKAWRDLEWSLPQPGPVF